MELRGLGVLLGILLLSRSSSQQISSRKATKKDTSKDAAIAELQKQMKDVVQELNLLKEQQALQTVCLKGMKIHRKCYLADPVKKRFHTASDDCHALGGVLGTPTSADENSQLGEYLRQSVGPDEPVWLGINDMMAEGVWADQTGLNVSYTNWDTSNFRSRQPNGGMAENCAVLSGASRGAWLDENCREERPSVCQFNIV